VNVYVNQAATLTLLHPSSNPAFFGQSVTFTAIVIQPIHGVGTPTGMVTFADGGNTLGTGTMQVVGGADVATFTINTLTVGTHNITATYSGDSDFTGSNRAISLLVMPAATATSLTSSANPAVSGQTVTFTVTVTANAPGSGTPTGMVAFRSNDTILAVVPLDSAGHASYTTSSLTVGMHNVIAVYRGWTDFSASTSTALVQTVTRDTTSPLLVSSQNSIKAGNPVIFTVTVYALAPGSGTPTGEVDFYDRATLLGSESLNASGVASLTVSDLPSGNDWITAKYDGDANFKTARTAVFVERVSNTVADELLAALVMSLDTKHLDVPG
jgi:hypothetical protein